MEERQTGRENVTLSTENHYARQDLHIIPSIFSAKHNLSGTGLTLRTASIVREVGQR